MTRSLSIALMLGALAPWDPGTVFRSRQDPVAPLRFHHLHFRVDDPSKAVTRTSEALAGTRIILGGLGVGVRVGDEYVLVDPADGTEPEAHDGLTPDEACRDCDFARGSRG